MTQRTEQPGCKDQDLFAAINYLLSAKTLNHSKDTVTCTYLMSQVVHYKNNIIRFVTDFTHSSFKLILEMNYWITGSLTVYC